MAYFSQDKYRDNANDKREQERQAQERLEHWARLRRDYPAIERTK